MQFERGRVFGVLMLSIAFLAVLYAQSLQAQPYFTTSGTTPITSNATISDTDWVLAGPLGDPPLVELGNNAALTINDPTGSAFLVVGYGGVGGGGPAGAFSMNAGTTINVVGTGAFPGSGIAVGYVGGIGSFTMDGGTIDLASTASPTAVTNLAIGTVSGTGSFTQSGGLVSVGNNFSVGAGAGSVGTYAIFGGTLQNTQTAVSGIHYVGDDGGSGTLLIGGDAVVNLAGTSGLWIGGDLVSSGDPGPSTGLVQQDGGTVTFTGNGLYLSGQVGDTGTYELNGGVLEIGGGKLMKGSGTALLEMGGGTLRVIGSTLNTTVALGLAFGTASTIDTNGYGARLQSGLSGGGDLVKTGSGQLWVTGTASVGALQLNEGSVRFDDTLASDSITVAEGTQLDLRAGVNTALNDVTVETGGELLGAVSADGDMTVELGGTQDIKRLSQATETGSYILDGELLVDLSGVDFNLARIKAETISLGEDAVISFYASGTQPAYGSDFRLFDTESLTGFESIQFVGLGSLADWTFTLDSETGVVEAVPEPSIYLMVAFGVGVAWWIRRRKVGA
jgi:hypothetical protein